MRAVATGVAWTAEAMDIAAEAARDRYVRVFMADDAKRKPRAYNGAMRVVDYQATPPSVQRYLPCVA